ncbi:MAG TPA: 4,5-DOPA dioxygenase extradiol [Woeseiaceae bacterium]|nr:4,5-DOPA dioxygenase extradiol [Woeseiaceae bacterium]
MESSPLPAIFLGHGSPMNAIGQNRYTEAWQRLGSRTPLPSAILAVSAHWFVSDTALTIGTRPRTIHDFRGFPEALYQVQYPAPGDPELARRVQRLLAPLHVTLDDTWGLDHGTWSVLCHMYPEANVPVVQLSINASQPAQYHFDIGQALAPLRDENVLILGSGNLVHNLRLYDRERTNAAPYDWAAGFERHARELIIANDVGPLIDYDSLGPDARLSIPTPEHYLPLLYVLGSHSGSDVVSFPIEGIEGRSISMLAVHVGGDTHGAMT